MQRQRSPSVSILILNKDGRDFLQDCISSIQKNTHYSNYEIVLIDNDSDDDSVQFVRENFPNINIIANDENLGFAEANNRGIDQTSSDYVLLLNNDTEVTPGWLTALVDFAESEDDFKIVSPKLVYENGDPQFLGDKVILHESGVPELLNRLLILIERRYDQPKEVVRAIGAAMMIQRELLEEIGYLDEEYEFYMEEFDYCLKARSAGYKVAYTPEAVVIHKSRSSASINPYFSFYLRRRSRIRFYLLNFTVPRLLAQIPIEVMTVIDSIYRGYSKWLFKAYLDSILDLSSLLEERKQRIQYHYTTNKICRLSEWIRAQ